MLFFRKNRFRQGIFTPEIQSREPLRVRLKLYFSEQRKLFIASFFRLWQRPVSSALTLIVLSVAISLPASLYALVDNARRPLESLHTTTHLSLFLKPEITNEAGRRIADHIRKNPQVMEITLMTKEQGLEELRAYSGFADALSGLITNPLPVVLVIKPAQPSSHELHELLNTLRKLPEADLVQFDSEWLEKLKAIVLITERCLEAFSFLLAIAVLFIVGNTIRLELETRQQEIVVASLLGGTDAFIRRPFLFSGIWYSVISGGIALLISDGLISGIRTPVEGLAQLYGSDFKIHLIGFTDGLTLLGISGFLGISGSWIVVNAYLRSTRPK